jgi:hypothetical protein
MSAGPASRLGASLVFIAALPGRLAPSNKGGAQLWHSCGAQSMPMSSACLPYKARGIRLGSIPAACRAFLA